MPLRKNTTYSQRPNYAARAAHARGERQFSRYDTSLIKPKRSKGPIIFGVILALIVVAAIGFGLNAFFNKPSANLIPAGQEAKVVVAQGATTQSIGETLVDAGLVGSVKEFTDHVSSLGAAQSLKPGSYTFVGGTKVDDLIAALVKGPGMGPSFTVPEGKKLTEVAAVVEKGTNGSVTADAFLKAASNVAAYRSSYPFLAEATTLEGFLFPKTYELKGDDTADSLIRTMLNQYQAEVSSLDFSYPKSQGLSEYDALILASIVEKESDENVRPQVAAVFYNRLGNDGDPNYGFLQSDATTAYEVGHDPTAEEVHADTPYSTYTNKGLPPTPICMPGLDALKAVCSPDKATMNDKYFYFYFKPDSTGKMKYYFSKTYEEHNEAIAKA